MKNTILFTALIFAFGIINGQSPIITQDNAYLIGDESIVTFCSNPVEPGPGGIDATWDFSELTAEEEFTFSYVEPGSTLWADDFPESNLCGIGEDNYHSYYRITEDFLTVEGFSGFITPQEEDTLKVIFEDREEYIPLPFEFGDTHTDVFAGTNEALGISISFDGEVSFEADGYGTLILPNGTYQNVIRYHLTRTQDNTFFGQTTTVTKEQWGWMSPDYRFWLCLMEINDDGFSTDELVWYAEIPIPLNVAGIEREKLTVFPNPVESGNSIIFNSDKNSAASAEMYSINGKLIHQQSINLRTGENLLELPSCAEGQYSLVIRTEDVIFTSKVSVRNR